MSNLNGEKLIKFINNKWRNQLCPMCGQRVWNVSDKIFEIREFNDGNMVIGGPDSSIMPVIPITCNNCGNTILINALVAELVEKE